MGLGHKVDAKDMNRQRFNHALSEWTKLERTSLNHHYHTVLYSEKEDKVPVAAQVLKTFGSLLGGSSWKGLAKQLAHATAETIGCSLAELWTMPTTVVRKAMVSMLVLLVVIDS